MTEKSSSFWRMVFTRRMIVTLFLGFSSGLPLLATGGTLKAWMTEAEVDLTVIGLFSLVGLPYTLKFLWAPLFDRFTLPFFGRRRGWMLSTQAALAVALVLLGGLQPQESPWLVAVMALFVTFFSASQDIVIDAHRRDTLSDQELGFGSALFINGYRIGMLTSGAFALWLADQVPWQMVYFVLAGTMAVGAVTTWLAPEPLRPEGSPVTLREAVVRPLAQFFRLPRAWEILAFILLYKIGDAMAAEMVTPFVLKLGFTKTTFAVIGKTFGLIATIVGGLIGGLIIYRLGIYWSLWGFGVLQAVSTAGFAWLATVGPVPEVLALVVAFENLASGMGTSAYAAFMASQCDRRFSATQYALLSSLMGIPRVLAAAPTGWMAKTLGWPSFFVICTALAVPGLLLLLPRGGRSLMAEDRDKSA